MERYTEFWVTPNLECCTPNFCSLTPTSCKVSIKLYGKTQTFSGSYTFYSSIKILERTLAIEDTLAPESSLFLLDFEIMFISVCR